MKTLLLPMLGLCAFLFSNCNPECVSLVGIDFPKHCEANEEILITATPLESLEGRNVFFNGKLGLNPHFVANQGLVVTVPSDVNGNVVEMKIEDPDCGDFTSVGIKVYGSGALFNQPGFVFPSPPEIIFPSVPPSFPPSIDNAWRSPQKSDYVLWFTSQVDGNGKKLPSLNQNGSFELSFCSSIPALYKGNPIYGIVDFKPGGKIHIFVDRRNNPIGDKQIEEFVGQFIDAKTTHHNNSTIDSCGTQLTVTGDMILLTSLRNDRQLLLLHPKDH